MANREFARFTPPAVCPVCGEDVPRGALACPECGADERSGWREDGALYGEDPALDGFDHGEFVKEEFNSRVKPRGISVFWWLAAIAVIAALFLLFARQGGL